MLEVSALGRYQVRETIGRGAMGVVYRGHDPAIDRPVALKTVTPPASLSEEELAKYLERFFLEAKIAGKLNHPNIVTTYDVATDAGDVPFIAMELVEGSSLEERLKQGRLPWKEAVELVIPVAEALGYAHERGIVHRDIKPANVLVDGRGIPKIADFGIAKLAHAELTQTGTVVGTPYFMSPEQLLGEAVDGRSDVFSLGVLLHNLVTGVRPFEGDSVAAIVSQVLHKHPKSLHELSPDVPEALDAVLGRALAKSPADRYPSAAEFALDLAAVRDGRAPENVPKRAMRAAAATAVSTAAASEASVESPATSSRRGLAVLVLALFGLAGFYVLVEHVVPAVANAVGLGFSVEHEARHDHLMSYCEGTLTLSANEVAYESTEHGEWIWSREQLASVRRPHPRRVVIETYEEILGVQALKRYNFIILDGEIDDETWERFSEP